MNIEYIAKKLCVYCENSSCKIYDKICDFKCPYGKMLLHTATTAYNCIKGVKNES